MEETVSILALLKDQFSAPAAKIGGSAEGLTKGVDKLSGSFGGLSTTIAGVLTAFVSLSAFRKSKDDATEAADAERRLSFALNEQADLVDRLTRSATRLQDTSFYDDDKIKAIAAQLRQMGVPINELDRALAAVVDTAAESGNGLEEVAQKVGLAINGQTRGLRSLLPEITDLNDFSTVDPLNFASAESYKDNIVRVFRLGNELLLFGETSGVGPQAQIGAEHVAVAGALLLVADIIGRIAGYLPEIIEVGLALSAIVGVLKTATALGATYQIIVGIVEATWGLVAALTAVDSLLAGLLLLISPIGVAIAAVVVAAGLMYAAFSSSGGEVVKLFKDIATGKTQIEDLFDVLSTMIEQAWNEVSGYLLVPLFVDMPKVALAAIKLVINTFTYLVKEAFASVATLIADLIEKAGNALSKLSGGKFGKDAKALADDIRQTIDVLGKQNSDSLDESVKNLTASMAEGDKKITQVKLDNNKLDKELSDRIFQRSQERNKKEVDAAKAKSDQQIAVTAAALSVADELDKQYQDQLAGRTKQNRDEQLAADIQSLKNKYEAGEILLSEYEAKRRSLDKESFDAEMKRLIDLRNEARDQADILPFGSPQQIDAARKRNAIQQQLTDLVLAYRKAVESTTADVLNKTDKEKAAIKELSDHYADYYKKLVEDEQKYNEMVLQNHIERLKAQGKNEEAAGIEREVARQQKLRELQKSEFYKPEDRKEFDQTAAIEERSAKMKGLINDHMAKLANTPDSVRYNAAYANAKKGNARLFGFKPADVGA